MYKISYKLYFSKNVAVTPVVIRDVYYRGRILQDIIEPGDPMRRCKIPSFNNTWLEIHIKI
jgi:hypothetical protein